MKTTRTGQTRRPLARIHVIHEALCSESWPNGSSLAEALEVSVKTIQRDLDFMRDEFLLMLPRFPRDESLPGLASFRFLRKRDAWDHGMTI